MSVFTYMVSNQPLLEINLTDAIIMKYGEYKKLNTETVENSILNLIDDKKDDLEILIMDPLKSNYLRITHCTNPPDSLEDYIQKPYVYWLEGQSEDAIWRGQLFDYINGLQNHHEGFEIWSIWFGDGLQDIHHLKFTRAGLQLADLDILKSLQMNYCITFE